MKIDLSCPIEIRGIDIAVFDHGMPCGYIHLYNLSNHTVVCLHAVARWMDSEGAVEEIPFEATGFTLFAHDEYTIRLSPKSLENAIEIELEFTRIQFKDEIPDWIAVPQSQITIPPADPISSKEEALLLRVAGHGAVQFSQMIPGAWICVCGRPNALDSDKCVRCMRGREVCLTRFSQKAVMALDLPPLPEIISETPPSPVLPFDTDRNLPSRSRRSKNANIRLACSITILILLICIAILLCCRKETPEPLPAAQTSLQYIMETLFQDAFSAKWV